LHVHIDDEHYSDNEGRSDTPSFIALSRTKSNARKTENEGLKKGRDNAHKESPDNMIWKK
jgi:hypothetical protein